MDFTEESGDTEAAERPPLLPPIDSSNKDDATHPPKGHAPKGVPVRSLGLPTTVFPKNSTPRSNLVNHPDDSSPNNAEYKRLMKAVPKTSEDSSPESAAIKEAKFKSAATAAHKEASSKAGGSKKASLGVASAKTKKEAYPKFNSPIRSSPESAPPARKNQGDIVKTNVDAFPSKSASKSSAIGEAAVKAATFKCAGSASAKSGSPSSGAGTAATAKCPAKSIAVPKSGSSEGHSFAAMKEASSKSTSSAASKPPPAAFPKDSGDASASLPLDPMNANAESHNDYSGVDDSKYENSSHRWKSDNDGYDNSGPSQGGGHQDGGYGDRPMDEQPPHADLDTITALRQAPQDMGESSTHHMDDNVGSAEPMQEQAEGAEAEQGWKDDGGSRWAKEGHSPRRAKEGERNNRDRSFEGSSPDKGWKNDRSGGGYEGSAADDNGWKNDGGDWNNSSNKGRPNGRGYKDEKGWKNDRGGEWKGDRGGDWNSRNYDDRGRGRDRRGNDRESGRSDRRGYDRDSGKSDRRRSDEKDGGRSDRRDRDGDKRRGHDDRRDGGDRNSDRRGHDNGYPTPPDQTRSDDTSKPETTTKRTIKRWGDLASSLDSQDSGNQNAEGGQGAADGGWKNETGPNNMGNQGWGEGNLRHGNDSSQGWMDDGGYGNSADQGQGQTGDNSGGYNNYGYGNSGNQMQMDGQGNNFAPSGDMIQDLNSATGDIPPPETCMTKAPGAPPPLDPFPNGLNNSFNGSPPIDPCMVKCPSPSNNYRCPSPNGGYALPNSPRGDAVNPMGGGQMGTTPSYSSSDNIGQEINPPLLSAPPVGFPNAPIEAYDPSALPPAMIPSSSSSSVKALEPAENNPPLSTSGGSAHNNACAAPALSEPQKKNIVDTQLPKRLKAVEASLRCLVDVLSSHKNGCSVDDLMSQCHKRLPPVKESEFRDYIHTSRYLCNLNDEQNWVMLAPPKSMIPESYAPIKYELTSYDKKCLGFLLLQSTKEKNIDFIYAVLNAIVETHDKVPKRTLQQTRVFIHLSILANTSSIGDVMHPLHTIQQQIAYCEQILCFDGEVKLAPAPLVDPLPLKQKDELDGVHMAGMQLLEGLQHNKQADWIIPNTTEGLAEMQRIQLEQVKKIAQAAKAEQEEAKARAEAEAAAKKLEKLTDDQRAAAAAEGERVAAENALAVSAQESEDDERARKKEHLAELARVQQQFRAAQEAARALTHGAQASNLGQPDQNQGAAPTASGQESGNHQFKGFVKADDFPPVPPPREASPVQNQQGPQPQPPLHGFKPQPPPDQPQPQPPLPMPMPPQIPAPRVPSPLPMQVTVHPPQGAQSPNQPTQVTLSHSFPQASAPQGTTSPIAPKTFPSASPGRAQTFPSAPGLQAQPAVHGSDHASVQSQVSHLMSGIISQDTINKQNQLLKEQAKKEQEAQQEKKKEAAEVAVNTAAAIAAEKFKAHSAGVVLPGEKKITPGRPLEEITGHKLEQILLNSAVKEGVDTIPISKLQEKYIPTQINMAMNDRQYKHRFLLSPRNEVTLLPLKGEYEMYIYQETLARIITNPREWEPSQARRLVARAACCVLNLPDMRAFVNALAKVCDMSHSQHAKNRMAAAIFVDAILHIAQQTDEQEHKYLEVIRLFEPHLFSTFFSHVPSVINAASMFSPEYAIALRLISKKWHSMRVFGRSLYDQMSKALNVEVENSRGVRLPTTGGIWETLVLSISPDNSRKDFFLKPWTPTMDNFKNLKPKVFMAAGHHPDSSSNTPKPGAPDDKLNVDDAAEGRAKKEDVHWKSPRRSRYDTRKRSLSSRTQSPSPSRKRRSSGSNSRVSKRPRSTGRTRSKTRSPMRARSFGRKSHRSRSPPKTSPYNKKQAGDAKSPALPTNNDDDDDKSSRLAKKKCSRSRSRSKAKKKSRSRSAKRGRGGKSRSRSRSKSSKSRSRSRRKSKKKKASRSKSRSKSRRRSRRAAKIRSKSRSKSRSRSRSKSRSASRKRGRGGGKSRSRSRSKTRRKSKKNAHRSRSRSKSRSRSRKASKTKYDMLSRSRSRSQVSIKKKKDNKSTCGVSSSTRRSSSAGSIGTPKKRQKSKDSSSKKHAQEEAAKEKERSPPKPRIFTDYDRLRAPPSSRNFYVFEPRLFDKDKLEWEISNGIWIDYEADPVYKQHKEAYLVEAKERRRKKREEEVTKGGEKERQKRAKEDEILKAEKEAKEKFEQKRAKQRRKEKRELERLQKKKESHKKMNKSKSSIVSASDRSSGDEK